MGAMSPLRLGSLSKMREVAVEALDGRFTVHWAPRLRLMPPTAVEVRFSELEGSDSLGGSQPVCS